jgi:hypothetical protein
MSPIASAAVTARRILVKRPWIYWAFVAVAALGAAASMLERADRIDATRESWGSQRTVLVAVGDHAPGDALTTEPRAVPAAIVPSGALTATGEPGDAVARQHIGAGEIVHTVDIAASDGPQAFTPLGWLAVPVVETPASGARLGDRVSVAGDGFVISPDAIVVGTHDDVTVVAVPEAEAQGVAAAGHAAGLTLLLHP